MADKVHASDLYLNRAAVTNAQSTAFWASTLSAGTVAEQDAHDDEDDFKAMSETAGLGTNWKDADAEIGSMLKRRVHSDDKLLEQILGKKAAAERRKAKAAAKSNIASQHAAPKPLNGMSAALQKPAVSQQRIQNGTPAEESEDEADLGRVALVGSKNTNRKKNKKRSVHSTQSMEATAEINQDVRPPDASEHAATVKAAVPEQKENTRHNDEEEEQRPRKKKATSYLDELLSKKKMKKSKGKA